MIRIWLVFIIFAVLIHLSITSWRALSGMEKWSLTKSVFYSIIVSLLAVLAMSVIVILF
jgi:hypothetical protein